MPRQPNETYAKAELFKQIWETHYVGETYIITGKDLKWAKELRGVDNDEIVRRIRVYLKDEWAGEHCRHSLSYFVSSINKFIPEKKEVKVSRNQPEILVIECSNCSTNHPANQPCPLPPEAESITMLDVEKALNTLAEKMSMK